jgi:SUMO ligase MMS21 Smc5/6 complex component
LDRLKDEQGSNAYRNLPLLLEHVYCAIDNDCLELAAMGIRTMIDVTLQEHIGPTKNNFPTKLEKAVEAKLIAQSHSEILLHVLNLGSETSHQLLLPSQDEIFMALDIAESLFQQLFIHPQHAETLKRRRDERAQCQ